MKTTLYKDESQAFEKAMVQNVALLNWYSLIHQMKSKLKKKL